MIPIAKGARSRSHTPNPNPSSESTAAAGSSSVRPRNRRLDTLEDQELGNTSGTENQGNRSRNVSPIPARHPSRSLASGSDSGSGGLLAPVDSVGRNGGGRSRRTSPAPGIWNTGWMSSLQQVANSVLGSMAPDEEDGVMRNYRGSRRKESGGQIPRKSIPAQWGPAEPSADKGESGGIGMGSTSERDAAARARRTRVLLEGRDEDDKALDINGKYKARTSLEEQRPGSSQDDGDALVYIHHVQKHDTFAGVVLKYNCQREVFRKANGLWSNEIQFKKTVVLPVDACAVKGRPCNPPSADSPYGVNLLTPTPRTEDTPSFTNGAWSSLHNGTSAEHPEEDENPWTHVRWVLIDSSPSSKPVEIARMPRKTLGYFPPRRRKSHTTPSTVSTPRGSADLTRISQSLSYSSNDPTSSTASTPSRRTSNLGLQPAQGINSVGSYFPTMTMPSSTRPRRESVGEAADRLGWMRGPGGVGTLGKNVRKPGPGRDGLNNWANKHIPGLAIDSLPSTSLLGAESAHFGFNEELAAIAEGAPVPLNGVSAVSGTTTPGLQGLGLENAAAAVEGFFRKLATKGVPGTPLGGARADADLIELLDGTGSDDGRGFELSPAGGGRSATPTRGGTGREDLDGVIRGRATAWGKGRKKD